ncbi:MAG: hypothetical protein Q7W16_05535 [Coriobacteriia bacterium]|nr:hypothetical protein [Coriobacteriia bacterium]
MKRTRTVRLTLAALVLVLTTALALGGCGEKQIKVETGQRVVCTYGETISNTIKVIEVPASEAHLYTVKTTRELCAKHRSLESLYAAAQQAIADGDLKTARAKLAEVLALEKAYGKAAEQAAAIDAGKTPKVDPTPPGPSSTPAEGTEPTGTGIPEGPVASLATFVPDTIPGYTASRVIPSEFALNRDYIPATKSALTSVVVVVEQYKTPALAKAAAESTIRSQYSGSQASLSIEGRTVLFGVYGSRYAAMAWNEGAVLIVVEGYSGGDKAIQTKDALESIVAVIIP